MNSPYAENILRSLRRITRAIDQHSRELSLRFNLTVPQLVCLRQLFLNGPTTSGNLSELVFLSQATVTGILDRLEQRGLIERKRGRPDRRRVTVSLTEEGTRLAEGMPWPLQEIFADRLSALSDEEQARIDQTLDQIVRMMSAQDIEAWPIVGSGEWNDITANHQNGIDGTGSTPSPRTFGEPSTVDLTSTGVADKN